MKQLRKILRPIKRWYRYHVYRRWDLIVCERDNSKPIYELRRHRVPLDDLEISLGKPEDEPLYRDPNWAHCHDKFVDRMKTLPGYSVMLGVINGKLASHGPFIKGTYYDKGMRFLFDPGPDAIYWFEGETAPEWRSTGLALVGMNWFFPRLEELTGCHKIVTYYRRNNRASRRLHERYSFVPIYMLVWRQLGPFRWTRKVALPDDLESS